MAKEATKDTLETGPFDSLEDAGKALENFPGLADPDEETGIPAEQGDADTDTDDDDETGTQEGDDAEDADDADAEGDDAEEADGDGEEEDKSGDIEELLEGSDDDKDENLIDLEIEGKKVRVPVDELKKGYLRQQDYSRKTEEVAERARQLTAAEQTFLDERQQYAERMDGLIGELETQLKTEEVDLDKLLDEDADEYVRQKARLEKRQAALEAAKSERTKQAEQERQARDEHFRNYVREQSAELVKHVPTFADPEKGPRLRKALQEHLTGYGFTVDELKSVFDNRTIRVALNSLRWEALQKSKAKVTKKAAGKPKVLKPGAKQPNVSRDTRRQAAAAKRLKRTGDVRDAAAALEKFV